MDKKSDDRQILQELRKRIFITGCQGGMAHFASCFSCLEIIYTLYGKGILRIDRADAAWKDRDRFVLSKGHAGLALYSVLHYFGFISDEIFASYLKPGAVIGGEPCKRDCKWVEASTGSLGHGLAAAVGMAAALKADGSPAKVYVILGDGECEEGSVWSAALLASAFRLDNLLVILDYNRIQKMDFVHKIIGNEKWAEKWTSFGWQAADVDGHNVDALAKALSEPNPDEKPKILIAHTVKGKGVSIMENNPNWHFKLPGRKELKVFLQELGIDSIETG